MQGKPPSLVDLCIQTVIGNIRYLGNVGEVDMHLLERILPYCTIEQLMHVENETGRDLSQVTDKIWKKIYEAVFGTRHTNDVVEKMKMCKGKFLWRQLYQAKLMVQREDQNQSLERLKQLYKKEDERRQSMQVQIRAKAPTSAKKRCFSEGYGDGSKELNNRIASKRKGIIPKSDMYL